MADKKKENRNINTAKARGELEKTFWSMSIENGDRADRLHQKNMPEQQE